MDQNKPGADQQVINVNLGDAGAEPFIGYLERRGCTLQYGKYRHFRVELPQGTRVEPYEPATEQWSDAQYCQILFPDGKQIIHYQPGDAIWGFIYGNPFD